MEILVSKILSTVILFAACLLFGLAPIKILGKLGTKSKSKTEKVMTFLNCFAGGVFLATVFLHMLPENKESVEDMLNNHGVKTQFAVAEFIITMGMFLIMFAEHLAMTLQHQRKTDTSYNLNSSGSLGKERQKLIEGHNNTNHHENQDYETGHLQSNGVSGYGATNTVNKSDFYKDNSDHDQICDTDVSEAKNGEVHLECEETNKNSHDYQSENIQPQTMVLAGHEDVIPKPNVHDHHHIEEDQLQGVRSFLLLLAMSCHKLFEGLAVGLQSSNTAVWNLFLAIIIHQCVISFSMGIQFSEYGKHVRRAVLFMVIFALMTPVGAAIGTALTEGAAGNSGVDDASAILQSISTGVFLYVTFFEVLGREVGSDHNIVKVLLTLSGYAIIALVQLLNPEPED